MKWSLTFRLLFDIEKRRYQRLLLNLRLFLVHYTQNEQELLHVNERLFYSGMADEYAKYMLKGLWQ